MRMYWLGAALLIAAVTQAPSAIAGSATVSYFGVVNNTQSVLGQMESAPDTDLANLFGGGNLEGDFLTATFVYSTSLGSQTTDGQTYDERDGGLGYPAASPLLSATLSIDNALTGGVYSYTFSPNYYADIYTSAGFLDEIGYSTAGDQTYTYIQPTAAAPTTLTSSFSGLGYGPASYFNPGATNTGSLDTIVFDTLEVTVSAVPEPSTWALMIAGLGGLGLVLRRQKSRREDGLGLCHSA